MMDTVTSSGSCFAEKCEQKESQEDMVGIRRIMVQQETLFKEQVQALHRLYKVQKLEMQDLEKRKNDLHFETAELTDGFSKFSGLEDKSGELVRPVARVYKPEMGSLSLHPFCLLKLFEGGGSVSFEGSFQRLDSYPNKEVTDFDLGSFPESWDNENGMMIQPDDSSPTSKGSGTASVEDSEYKSGKSNNTSEDSLVTTSSGKVVSCNTEGNQDASPADPIDGKAKLSHQDSFASVNGFLNSSSSESEDNNSKVAATSNNIEGTNVAQVRFSKMELSSSGQTPLSCPRYRFYVTGFAHRRQQAFKTGSTGVEGKASVPASEGVQSLGFHDSSIESSNPSSPIKRKHLKETIDSEAGYNKLLKFSEPLETIPSRATP